MSHPLRQRLPRDKLRRNIVLRSNLTALIHRYDVRMAQSRRRLGLGAEALNLVLVVRPKNRHLESHFAVELRIVSPIDSPVSSLPEQLFELKSPQLPQALALLAAFR